MRPRLLDLFCGAGGAAMGYHQAGFDVVGVDIAPQPNYPFEFVQADALDWLEEWVLSGHDVFDAIHASPPCQAYSANRNNWNARTDHPELIEPTRELLRDSRLPYVIENVPQAPLENAIQLCGTAFHLGLSRDDAEWRHPSTWDRIGPKGRELRRHRLFELSFGLMVSPCWHRRPTIGIYGDHARANRDIGPNFSTLDRVRLAQLAMGINWTDDWDELREAIPPAYTEFIGEQLLAHLNLSPARRKPVKAAATIALLIMLAAPAAKASDKIDRLTYDQLADRADRAIRNGHVYSHRWGDASPYLQKLCYEMVDRAFRPYGTQAWARMVVNRESGCNPAAINSSSGTTGIAQIHPAYHRWIDYRRVQRDMRYALATFVRLSRGGRNTGPWCLC